MSRLVVISNRVAVPKARGAAGAQGGLAGALHSALKSRKGLWFGWSGEETDAFEGKIDFQRHDGVTTATIDLEPQDVEEYPRRLFTVCVFDNTYHLSSFVIVRPHVIMAPLMKFCRV